jgi:hypothetical protein
MNVIFGIILETARTQCRVATMRPGFRLRGIHLNTEYVLTEYVTTQPGEPYRLFPFGAIYKGGRKRTITPEMARAFRLPHFKPPIKLGSHDERTPAGGQILALEVREDGLYAVPEFTEKGMQSLTEGDYRYHSPEVIWEGSGLEDPVTGEMIPGPMIVGDALLHTPHLGEMAAMYQYEIIDKEADMPDEMYSVPKSLWDKFFSWFDRVSTVSEPVTSALETLDITLTEEYKAAIQERDQAKAELEKLQAEQVKKDQFTALVSELQGERFGSVYVSLATAEEAAGMLSGMTQDQREWVMRNFSALVAQVNESQLTGEIGSTGAGADPDPMKALNAAIEAKMAEKSVRYPDAYAMVRAEQPELFKAVYGGK